MRNNVIGGTLAVILTLLPMAAFANTVFHLDSPTDGSTVFGLVEVRGWILDDGQECGPPPNWDACEWTAAPVSSIDLYVDDDFVASADLGQARWDVLQAYPWYAGTPYERPGFSVSFDASHFVSGEHTFFLRVTYSDMTTEDFGTSTVTVDPTRNQAPFGELEMPGENQPMNGVYPITGWALDDGSLSKVEIMVDGLIDGQAQTEIPRPDISYRFPSVSDSGQAGFRRMYNTSKLTNGIHSIAVRLTDDQGAVRVIGNRFVQVFNTTNNLPPFGGIDWPPPDHIMYSDACTVQGGFSGGDEYEDPTVIEWVSGWALDVGARTATDGVAYVQLLIDGEIIKDTWVDSFYYPWMENISELVNAYGLPRMDIQNMFPDVPNAKDAGFVFALDMSDLMLNRGYRQGLHMLTIRAGDWDGNNVADIARIPVIFDCSDDRDRPSWGDIYTPENMERVSGVTELTGWALDFEVVQEVEIWLDGEFIDYADEIDRPTPEVEYLYAWLPDWMTEDCGWSYDLDTVGHVLDDGTHISDGPHTLVVWTSDYWGQRTIIGERTFVVDNNGKSLEKKAHEGASLR